MFKNFEKMYDSSLANSGQILTYRGFCNKYVC